MCRVRVSLSAPNRLSPFTVRSYASSRPSHKHWPVPLRVSPHLFGGHTCQCRVFQVESQGRRLSIRRAQHAPFMFPAKGTVLQPGAPTLVFRQSNNHLAPLPESGLTCLQAGSPVCTMCAAGRGYYCSGVLHPHYSGGARKYETAAGVAGAVH